MEIQKDYPLKNKNSFGVPASAKYFAEIETIEQLIVLLKNPELKNESKLILGGGSNILLTKDFEGIVIANRIKGIKILSENDDEVIISSGGGVVWDDLVEFTVARNFGGLENLTLIPGTVGAAPIQNIGAYGVELKDTFVSLKAMELSSFELREFQREDCNFGYRDSVFKQKYKGKYFIYEVTFRLKKNPELNISYKSLKEEFEKIENLDPTVRIISEIVKKIRTSKLPDPKILGNAGSFFKNPELNKEEFEVLKTQYEDLPFYKIDDDIFKVPAGWLIEKCGLRGFRDGNVGTYPNQALVIVNYGVNSGEEIKNFSKKIQQIVFDKFGVNLQSEVNII